jgi:AsmA protein
MNWQLDQTAITGGLSIDDFDTLATRFELALDRLNLDGYMAPDADDSGAEDAAEIPVDMIRDLLLDGRLTAGELIIADLKLQNLSAAVRARDGILRLDPLQARLYGGHYRGVITIDATGPKALLTLDQQLDSVQVAEILRGLYGSDRLGGSVSLQVSGTGAGNTQTELLKALTGNVAMSLSDGVYRGMDVGYEVQRALALVRKEAAPSAPAKMETPIRALSFAGQMANGVLGTDQLSAEIPFFRLAGKGGINLLELALDYQLNAQVLKKDDTTAGQNLADLVNATIPLTISGPLASPRVGVDMKNMVTNTIRDTLQDRAREALLKSLGGATTESPPATQTTDGPAGSAPEESTPAAEPEEPKADSAKDLLKRGLRDLLTPKEPQPEG